MQTLQKIRQEIDKIDKKIADLLKSRAEKSQKIALIKKNHRLKVTDKDREKKILENLESEYEKEIFKKILQQSRKIQREALTKG